MLPAHLFDIDTVDCADELELLLRGTSIDVVLLDLTVPSLDNRKSFETVKSGYLPPPLPLGGKRIPG